MRRSYRLVLFLVCAVTGQLSAQSAQTNGDVIDLVAEGWSVEEINSQIATWTPQFRFGFQDISELVEHGVPDEVIRFMMTRDDVHPRPISKAKLRALELDLSNLEAQLRRKRETIAVNKARVVQLVIEKRRADLQALRKVSEGRGIR